MIRFHTPVIGIAFAVCTTVVPAGLQAEPQIMQPLPLMMETTPNPGARHHQEARLLLAQAKLGEAPAFPHVAPSTADTPAAPSAQEARQSSNFPLMPGPYESVLIVLAAAIAGAIGLWLGHIAGFVRLFRGDESWPHTRA